MATGRLITIGDVHGCADDLARLLDWLQPQPEDRLIFVGDLVNKGFDSAGVVDQAIALQAEAVMGNHELRLLRYRREGDPTILKEYDKVTLQQLQPAHWDYLERMPLTLTEPAYNTVTVSYTHLTLPTKRIV